MTVRSATFHCRFSYNHMFGADCTSLYLLLIVTGELGTISFVEVIPKYPPVPTGSPPGGICSDLIRCLGGSLCNSGVCICPDKPMQVVDGRCVVIPQPIANTAIVEVHHQVGNQKTFVAVGSPCGATMICVGGAVCVDGICQCSKGLRQVLNRCVREPAAKVQPIVGPKVVLPQPIPRRAEAPYCLNDDMCNGHSICINSKCSCPAGTALLNDHCVPTVLDTFETPTRQSASGHVPCSRDEECSQGSMCVQGACKCPPGFRKLGDGSCRGTILDSLCTMDQNCGDQAICIKGRCQCPPGTVQHGGLCILLNPASARKLSPQRSPALAPLCPNEVSPVVDPVNHGYVRCNAETSCPIGSYCHASGGALDSAPFYCCPVNRRSRKWIRQA
uniref:EGF-like domain-containing protein n=1 Tax=Trichuris muris TaxID=70415 RepID=A0A5S6QYW8_TRIMR